MSEICDAFTCPPDVAERQDLILVRGILDYRNAKQAVAWFNDGSKGAAELVKHPELLTLLLELKRAQGGTEQTVAEVMAGQPAASDEE